MSAMTISATSIPAAGSESAAAGYLTVMKAVTGQLRALPAASWGAGTDCTGWTVRDMAAHLLGAQEDVMGVRATLRHRRQGHKRHPSLSPLDAANQAQIDAHAELSPAALVQAYEANFAKVSHRVRTFPRVLAGIPVDKSMAPGHSPLRLGYLYNVIYLRDAWMHAIDLARATGVPRGTAGADQLVVEQIMRDVAVEWASGPAAAGGIEPASGPGLELELTGEISGSWHLGGAGLQTRAAGVGLEFVRGLSGRTPDSGLACVAGDPRQVERLAALRILF
ncbi:uncharacterized protein (TIGR03083 family) [Arthrobacter silviterrae]|uniref:Maleylpyruvate isomerase family mycothiol-dependent enzyme n=1 Tax=Arthrobacter silviterrae TaxID=2026658 RepID=A0ABX0DAW0_9MICC|nr:MULTISPECIES: maleylpyruvate isomerase family mycothiol-dependent enzyme [Arthrobacter]MCU6480853.1 maleylpyruvate isomerase family mycothiol-dependent enzyme [Arthrobacter sp. A2-55]MDQ0278954.1 uncharacterized protein (TIGR03083 family) [Arthrobacter silviterrae]NGN84057.1 maleylpyruvate isomerase family mycothiol-dependent enzyme [Arthrobacter silviterrae]